MQNNKEIGRDKERIAAKYLSEHGMKVRECNFYTRTGEIDIIGYDEGYLVFAEVKYRSSEKKGSPFDAVDLRKQKKICRAAEYYMYLHHLPSDTPVRYDVIGISGSEITWIKNAFEHCCI